MRHLKRYVLWLAAIAVVILAPVQTSSSNAPISGPLQFESDDRGSFLTYTAFVVCFDSSLKVPYFCIHVLREQELVPADGQKARRQRGFFVDPRIAAWSATNADYKASGYDRGHMVPAGDFDASQGLKDETFTYANVTPQKPALNRGLWLQIETAIRAAVCRDHADAVVITGALYSMVGVPRLGPGRVGVPDYLYKMAYFPGLNVMYAFLVDNSLSMYYGSCVDYQVRVDDIERLANQDFFDLVDRHLQDSLESLIIPIR